MTHKRVFYINIWGFLTIFYGLNPNLSARVEFFIQISTSYTKYSELFLNLDKLKKLSTDFLELSTYLRKLSTIFKSYPQVMQLCNLSWIF